MLTGLVFSYMSGIIHPYYTVDLAPAIGALTGIGAVARWRTDCWPALIVLAGTLLVTVGWAWVLGLWLQPGLAALAAGGHRGGRGRPRRA